MPCEHLQPLVDAARARGVNVEPTTSPYGDDFTWWRCDCTFNAVALRARLHLAECVSYVEYNGMSAGSDATWTCKEHREVLLGPHSSFAPKGTPQIS